METRRAESFSDGVFAVAITVLIFNLLPIARAGITVRALLHEWPQYAGYVVSFLTIGIVWLNHHSMLGHLARINRVTLVINLLLLMTVVAVPFSTALVAANLGSGSASGAKIATVVYGLVMIAMSVAFSAMWMYLASHQQSLVAHRIRSPLQGWVRFSGGLVGYIAATLVALASPGAALAIDGVIAVYYLFEHLPELGPIEGAERSDTEPSDPERSDEGSEPRG